MAAPRRLLGCGGVRVTAQRGREQLVLVGHARCAAACGGCGGEAGARGGVAGGGRYGARCPPAVMMAAEVSVVLFFCVRNGREEGRGSWLGFSGRLSFMNYSLVRRRRGRLEVGIEDIMERRLFVCWELINGGLAENTDT